MAEDLVMPKAPKGWRPTSDQMQRVANDSRLQRLSNDELYFYFNKPKSGSATKQGSSSQQKSQPKPQGKPATSGGVFGWVDQVKKALGGN